MLLTHLREINRQGIENHFLFDKFKKKHEYTVRPCRKIQVPVIAAIVCGFKVIVSMDKQAFFYNI
jgi:hypothetical protein